MLIQIPVTIGFNCEDGHATFRAARGFARTFTVRYDTADSDRPAEYCTAYPPPDNASWYPDHAGILLEFMPSNVDRAITAAAERYPEGYAAIKDPPIKDQMMAMHDSTIQMLRDA